MRKVIDSNQDLCVGCNRCARECPIETANFTYQNEEGNIKVKVDAAKCIVCGACITVCKHGARYYVDDTQSFFADLAAGAPLSVIAAPSFKTNFPEWKRLLSYLRKAGVNKIYDVSLGADICIWAHLRYIEKYKPRSIVTQPCASIVSYCEMHRHELLGNLSPIHSPMACVAAYMRKYEGITGKIAALSPCIAKAVEFEAIGSIQYNVTFTRLREFINAHEIILPEEESGFDHHESGPGCLFPTPGGLKENIEFFTGRTLRVDKAEGRDVYKKLDAYAAAPVELLPQIFDVLNCQEGCNIGPGCPHDKDFFQLQTAMCAARQAVAGRRDASYYDAAYARYDELFDLGDFIREYTPVRAGSAEVTETDIQNAFALLEKDTYAKQNFNCGACGSNTCRDMARKIALKVNIPINCIVKEQNKNKELYQRNAKYIDLINAIGQNLLSAGDDKHTDAILNSTRTLTSLIRICSAAIWKFQRDGEGRPCVEQAFLWPRREEGETERVYWSQAPECFTALSQGQTIIRHERGMSDAEKTLFPEESFASMLLAPVLIKEQFWGVIAVSSDQERPFSDEEVSVVISSGLLVVSSLIEKEMTENLIAAREAALSGMHAKSDFLSRMSHEMRTPMNAIIGMTKIADATNDIDKLKYCLATVGTSAEHLLGLINNILDLSKIESGKFDLNNAPFSLERMLIKVCNIVIDKVDQKKQKLHVAIDERIPDQAAGDELRLSQVIANLLSNAVKFTPEEGRITIRVDQVHAGNKRQVLRFSVIDSGIGMTADQLGRLFNPFEQADDSITSRFGGTGLGLAISKSIVEKMNGKIWAESQPDHGSRFIFEVELQPLAPSSALPAAAASRPGIRILFADRDEESREHFFGLAGKLGIRADTANGAAAAASLAEEAKRRGAPYDALFAAANVQDPGDAGNLARCAAALPDGGIVLVASFLEWQKTESAARSLGIGKFISRPLFPSAVAEILAVLSGAPYGAAGEAADGRAAGREKDNDFSGTTLLLVEDVELNREIFIALLEHTNVAIDTAENGRVAVRKFEQNPDKYDLIVMDLQMPEMDGYAATKAIRASVAERARSVPIIAMTANAFKEDIDKCLENGMNGHLAKPIDLDAVMAAITRHANPRGTRPPC